MLDKNLKSWVDIPANSDFSIHNLPFGIYSDKTRSKRVGVAIGDQILDLSKVHALGIFDDFHLPKTVFLNDFLNDFIALGKPITQAIRLRIQRELTHPDSILRSKPVFATQAQSEMHLPVKIGDYTDFYSSIEHATNVGKMFRDPENALLPNWRHLPVGYHGRASSIIPSGVSIHRPYGQMKPEQGSPVYGVTKRLDFELEMAFIVGKSTQLGETIPVAKAEDHIFGMVIFNDWSSRDVQKWEYVPLGPFLSKNFASSISPWVVTMEALEAFRVAGPKQDPEVLPYLQFSGNRNFDLHLEVDLAPEKLPFTRICTSNFKYMYWNMAQQLAHHTMNGCNVNIGDMMASGTISGPDPSGYGSMLELTWGGSKALTLVDGSTRKFVEDGDTVKMSAYGLANGVRIGFGNVSTKILPPR